MQRRNVGGDEVDGPRAIEHFPFDSNQPISAYIDTTSGDKHVIATEKLLAPRDDGLVREMKTRKVVSREQIQERTETEDVKHLGDFSDEVSRIDFYRKCVALCARKTIFFALYLYRMGE